MHLETNDTPDVIREWRYRRNVDVRAVEDPPYYGVLERFAVNRHDRTMLVL